MGTRFIATPEAYCHDNYKKRVVELEEDGTVVTRAASGKPCRLIRNAFTREWEKREAEILPFPIQGARVGREAGIRAREQGDIEHGNAPCGQSAALIRGIVPAGEVVRRLLTEAVANVAEKYRKLLLAPLGSAGSIWEKGRRYVIMMVSPAESYLEGLLDLAARNGLKTVAFIYEDTLFPKTSVRGAMASARKRGLEIVFVEAYP